MFLSRVEYMALCVEANEHCLKPIVSLLHEVTAKHLFRAYFCYILMLVRVTADSLAQA